MLEGEKDICNGGTIQKFKENDAFGLVRGRNMRRKHSISNFIYKLIIYYHDIYHKK